MWEAQVKNFHHIISSGWSSATHDPVETCKINSGQAEREEIAEDILLTFTL